MSRWEYKRKDDTFSGSMIKTYFSCPRLYKYRYIDKIKSMSPKPTYIGTVVHAVLEDYFCDKMDTGVYPSEKDTLERCMDLTIDFTTQDDVVLDEDMTVDFLLEANSMIVKEFVRNIAPKIEPLAVETEFGFKSPCGNTISGQTDIIFNIHGSSTKILGDYKNMGTKMPLEKVQYKSHQFAIYSKAMDIPTIQVFNMVKNKIDENGKMKKVNRKTSYNHVAYEESMHEEVIELSSTCRVLTFQIDPTLISRTLEAMDQGVAMIKEGYFPKCFPGSYEWCSPKGCEMWEHCSKDSYETIHPRFLKLDI